MWLFGQNQAPRRAETSGGRRSDCRACFNEFLVRLVRVDQEDLDDSGSELQAAQAALTEADGAHCSEERVTGRKHVDDVQRTKP